MCLSTKTPADPKLPPERQASRLPDNQTVRSQAGQRAADQQRAAANTILTSGTGVTNASQTVKKTLLGA